VSIHEPSVDTKELIDRLLTNLGENCKQILQAVIFHRTPMKKVAEEMGYADASIVKTRHYKCKKRLSKVFQDNPQYVTQLKNGILA
jgi:hypothetical protein